jgi:hypothetical protein
MLTRMLGPLSVLCLGIVVMFVFFGVLAGIAPGEVLWATIAVCALTLLLTVRSLYVRHELDEHGNRDIFRSINRLRERRGF